MAEIVKFPGHTRNDIDPDNVLEGAKGQLNCVLVLGSGTDGNDWFAASTGDKAVLLLLCEQFRHDLLDGRFDNG
jgi:hypothetical protein